MQRSASAPSAPSQQLTATAGVSLSQQLQATLGGTGRPEALDLVGETLHQQLQRSLGERRRGGPHEQMRSAPFRLRRTRGCEITHSSLEEPLAVYKTLEPLRPGLKSTQRRYHLMDGYKCFDQDTIVVEARDTLSKTKVGLLRSASGAVTYSDTHRKKLELDVQEVARIMATEGVPGGGHAWTPKKLEQVFRQHTGRSGCWAHYEVPFREFLALFPRTFDNYNNGEYIRLVNARRSFVCDTGEEALIRLAKARELGYVEQQSQVEGSRHFRPQPVVLPELKQHRIKAVFKYHEGMAPSQSDEDSRQRPSFFEASDHDPTYRRTT